MSAHPRNPENGKPALDIFYLLRFIWAYKYLIIASMLVGSLAALAVGAFRAANNTSKIHEFNVFVDFEITPGRSADYSARIASIFRSSIQLQEVSDEMSAALRSSSKNPQVSIEVIRIFSSPGRIITQLRSNQKVTATDLSDGIAQSLTKFLNAENMRLASRKTNADSELRRLYALQANTLYTILKQGSQANPKILDLYSQLVTESDKDGRLLTDRDVFALLSVLPKDPAYTDLANGFFEVSGQIDRIIAGRARKNSNLEPFAPVSASEVAIEPAKDFSLQNESMILLGIGLLVGTLTGFLIAAILKFVSDNKKKLSEIFKS